MCCILSAPIQNASVKTRNLKHLEILEMYLQVTQYDLYAHNQFQSSSHSYILM